ncbi:LacI family DNA-binding transcriptional regulator [Formosa haliotis]|uniref:LacI family DNA-binding transcriptional regulator n=1 Tax=Formosa haliotis TaxID=1555194 RepID=UPI000825EA58|nr:LacI family DNA-binding transcriptional regulator [Formosa haliotis]
MKDEKITIKDVANYLNVSTSTVSRALTDHHSISKKTKLKVKKAAEKLNYTPNNIAASLRNGKLNSIGVILPKINSTFMSNCIFGIEKITQPAGYNLIICQSNENYENEVRNIKSLLDSQVSGIMISLSNETTNTDHLQTVIDKDIPLVLFDRTSDLLDVDSVVNDDYKSTIAAISHLYSQGYKKIAILSGPTHIYVYKNRMQGYLDALKLCKLKKNEDWIFDGVKNKLEAQAITQNIFNESNTPDAIFCTGDNIALGVLQTLNKMNIEVPKTVGVMGYSNDTFSEITQPTLSSVEQHPQDIGSNAASILLESIENKKKADKKLHKKIYVKPKLIIRESTTRTQTYLE